MASDPRAPSRTLTMSMIENEDDDDFQIPTKPLAFSLNLPPSSSTTNLSRSEPLRPRNGPPARKKSRLSLSSGKENRRISATKKIGPERRDLSPCGSGGIVNADKTLGVVPDPTNSCEFGYGAAIGDEKVESSASEICPSQITDEKNGLCVLRSGVTLVREVPVAEKGGEKSDVLESGGDPLPATPPVARVALYAGSIESRLLRAGAVGFAPRENENRGIVLDEEGDFDAGTQLKELMELCSEVNSGVDVAVEDSKIGVVICPLCGIDISGMSEELRHVHTNSCLDNASVSEAVVCNDEKNPSHQGTDFVRVCEFLRSLELSRYEEAFIREEVDWETLQWLTEEDLMSIGIASLGPRKKIVNALNNLRRGRNDPHEASSNGLKSSTEKKAKASPGNKLITEYFQGPMNGVVHTSSKTSSAVVNNISSVQKRITARKPAGHTKLKDIPPWCSIPGTCFRVDAFRFLRGDCSHWFLTHFHLDHYQGLTKNFRHGKIYCSSVTASLVNMKIGIPWERLHVLPLGEKMDIDGVGVTCLDANHCPGSIILLFEVPNGKVILHTGDFRFREAMTACSILQSYNVHTLILDTTYCNPQYDFPKQEAVIQFVIEAIQAETFNPKTLFLIGSYTVGKERLFLEVARYLRKKVYVGAAKLRLLQCLGFPQEDMQWFTSNEMESDIHVVPMWTIASFKRMKHISNQYSGRYNLIVAFSPTGWTFGKGKKKSPGKRWQQGTIIRYEVPYSEHSSFSELQEFVRFISPEVIIPSVNNTGPQSADSMITLLMSDLHSGSSS